MKDDIINQAVKRLKAGKLIIIPTESVYGLVADPKNHQAVESVFIAKKRARHLALTIHIAKPQDIYPWAIDIPAAASQLMSAFWPGPLTIILKKSACVPSSITGNKNTVGLRCPNHVIAHNIIKQYGHGLIMTSANISSHPAPTTATSAKQQLGQYSDLIIDDGPCQLGIASTIVDLSGLSPIITRLGSITKEDIAKVLRKPLSDWT